MTRQEIIDGFHKVYLAKIAEETAKRGVVGAPRGGGILMSELTRIHNEAIADYVADLLYRLGLAPLCELKPMDYKELV